MTVMAKDTNREDAIRVAGLRKIFSNFTAL